MAYAENRDGKLTGSWVGEVVIFDPLTKRRMRFATKKEAYEYELKMRQRQQEGAISYGIRR